MLSLGGCNATPPAEIPIRARASNIPKREHENIPSLQSSARHSTALQRNHVRHPLREARHGIPLQARHRARLPVFRSLWDPKPHTRTPDPERRTPRHASESLDLRSRGPGRAGLGGASVSGGKRGRQAQTVKAQQVSSTRTFVFLDTS